MAYPSATLLRTPAEVLVLGEAIPACTGIAFEGNGFTITFDVDADSAFDASSHAITTAAKCLVDDLGNAHITRVNVARDKAPSLSLFVNEVYE